MHLLDLAIIAAYLGGFVAGTVVVLAAKILELASWLWDVLTGSLATFATGVAVSRLTREGAGLEP